MVTVSVSVLLFAGTVFVCVFQVECGDVIKDRICATLFSADDYKGDTFMLKDFDQSVNLKKEYRHSLNGWQQTNSIRVEDRCKLTVCSDTYFMGDCQQIIELDENGTLEIDISAVQSVNCTCKKKCSCNDISIPRDSFQYGFVGRAYLNGDCSTCNTEYVNLYNHFSLSDKSKDSVKAFVIPKHCNITVYPLPRYEGDELTLPGPVYQGFNGTVGSYEIYCDEDTQSEPQTQLSIETGRPCISIPADREALLEILHSNDTLLYHMGFQAAVKSAKNGRSARHAYVIIIGDIQPYWLGFPQCKHGHWNKIGECRIPVELDDLGISTHLSVITVPIAFNDSVDDYAMMANLEEYLSTHEELHSVIPNAVIVYDWLHDDTFADQDSRFHRRAHTVHQLRSRLVDEKYSNVVFLLNFLNALSSAEDKRQPDERIALFEDELANQWAFPNPINFCLKSGIRAHLPFVNGHVRMENEEYFPRNLEVSIDNICEKGGDPLGEAIFNAVFDDNKTPRFSIESVTREVMVDKSKVDEYRKMYQVAPSQRAISRQLAEVKWKLRIHDVEHQNDVQALKTLVETEQREREVDRERIKAWEKLKSHMKKILN